ncbi:DUF1178 family protein [Roseovarius sp. CAU 1744]|uniref:DUF1178 family protein n=1 Tax=Roseovarius sp. CAU 1744 TaxID=3140368 RepID=UPI00325BF9DC
MIQFALRCDDDHRFESWFKSSEAFDKLHKAGLVTCIICGSSKVEKALMAPKVRDSRSQRPAETPSIQEQALAALRKQIEQNSEYVGMNFAREARDIKDGIAPERSIYGEARPDEAKKLIEDGVPVTPLPFVPGRKSN